MPRQTQEPILPDIVAGLGTTSRFPRHWFAVIGAFLLWLPTLAAAQPPQTIDSRIRRLPPFDPYASRAELGLLDEVGSNPSTELPEGVRNQFLQAAIFESTYLPGDGDDYGLLNLNAEISLGLPGPLPLSMFLISPGFEWTNLTGPITLDAPSNLYRASTQVQFRGLVTDKLGYEISVSPGLYGDLQSETSEAFRIPGHLGLRYQWSPWHDFYLGVLFLDREDVNFLPLGGVVWKPHEDLKIELLFPRPRIAWRAFTQNHLLDCREHWFYIVSEFGGGSWAVQRLNGTEDTITLRDFRLLLGWEGLVQDGLDLKFEVAYVFGRSLEYSNTAEEIKPNDTVMLRFGFGY